MKTKQQSREPESGRFLQIGELARNVGVSQRTIHFYEQSGLIKPVSRQGTGYRYYDESSIDRLQRIVQLKSLGLSLDDIRGVIDLYFTDPSGISGKKKVVPILEKQLADADEKIRKLSRFRDEILKNIAKLKALISNSE